MTEEVPAAGSMPECNGSVAPEKGLCQLIDELPKPLGTVPYANADTSPDTPPAEGNGEENRNSLAEDIVCGAFDGEKQCQEKQEEDDGTLRQGPGDTRGTGTDGQDSEEGPGSGELGTDPSPGEQAVQSPAASAHGGGSTAEEEEEVEEEEEEDTEEDEVQVIDMKKENSELSCLKQPDSVTGTSPTSPSCNSQLEKPGEQPSLGKKNDISRHSYSRYNTISYRRIRKGNTKQRIDEFESMMHL